MADALKTAIRARDMAGLKSALARVPMPVATRAVGEAARMGWLAGLKRLTKHGAGVNASYRNYRPIHALIQEKPHEGGSHRRAWMDGVRSGHLARQ